MAIGALDWTRGRPGLYILVFLLGFGGVTYFWTLVDRPPEARFVLDMTVPPLTVSPWYVDLYVNGVAGEPLRTAVKPGGRYRYEWPCLVRQITFLRLDPVQAKGIEVAIHSLTVEAHGNLVHRFGPEELLTWNKVEPGRVGSEGFYLRGDREVNHIEAHLPPIDVPISLGLGEWAQQMPHDWYTRFFYVMLVVVVLAVLGGIAQSSGRFDWLLVLLIVPFVGWSVIWTRGIRGMPLSPAAAVGQSSYSGFSKDRDTVVMILLVIIPLIAALTIRHLTVKWAKISTYFAPAWYRISMASVQIGKAFRSPMVLLTAVGIVVVLYNLWGAEYNATVVPKQEFPPGWDDANLYLWSYLYQTGALPFRDFWYPYGNQIAGTGAFPWGFLYERVYSTSLFIVSLVSFYLIANRLPGRAIMMFAIWFGLYHQRVILGSRYALLVPFVLTYVVARKETARLSLAHVAFWSCILIGLMGSLDVLIYAGLVLFVVIALDAFRDWRLFWETLGPRLVREFAVPAGLILGYLILTAINGQLPGILGFFLNLSRVSSYAATPSSLDDWVALRVLDDGFLMWSVPLLLGLGIYSYLTDPPERKDVGLSVLLLGCSTLMLFYKLQVHQGYAIFLGVDVPIAAWLVLVFARHRRMTSFQSCIVILALGTVFGSLVKTGAWKTFYQHFEHPSVLWNDAKALFQESSFSREYVVRRWDLKNFRQHPELLAVVDAIRPKLSANPNDLFTISDDSMLYIMARKRPPYYTNLYDGSFLGAQERTVSWLRTNRPSVVVYNVRHQDVFGIPAVVRDPLIFEEVILNYVVDRRIGDYAILRRRTAGEAVDLPFWADVLGEVNLGQLPHNTSFSQFEECGNANDCAEFLQITPKYPVDQPAEAMVDVAVDAHRFRIRFQLVPGGDEVIPLERLWFWGALRRAGSHPVVAAQSPLIDVALVRRARRDDILY